MLSESLLGTTKDQPNLSSLLLWQDSSKELKKKQHKKKFIFLLEKYSFKIFFFYLCIEKN